MKNKTIPLKSFFVSKGLIIAFLSLSGLWIASASATTLYLEEFAGLPSQFLQGKEPTVTTDGAVWSSSTWMHDGSFTASASASSIGRNAFLPFVPQPGFVYTLSATVSISTATNGFVALGFTEFGSVGSGFAIDTINAAPFMFMRSSDNSSNPEETMTYQGPSTFGSQSHGQNGSIQEFKIVLDTTETLWSATFSVNDNELRTVSYASNPVISFVGFGVNAGNNGRLNGIEAGIQDFALTAIPEPGYFAAIFGISALTLAYLRRRRCS